MKKYKNILWLMILAVIMTSISGCTKTTGVGGLTNVQNTEKVDDTQLSITVEGDKYPLTVKDFLKKETILKRETREDSCIVWYSLNIWYDLGGKSVCTSDVSDNVKLILEHREEIRNLPTIGPVYSIDMESVIPHKPDLIIAQVGTQSTQAKKLREMGF